LDSESEDEFNKIGIENVEQSAGGLPSGCCSALCAVHQPDAADSRLCEQARSGVHR
jgi:hypothetical protein